MESEKFYNLTWYDWGMYADRIYDQRLKRREDHELQIEMTRSMMAVHARLGGNKNAKPQDFWTLSYDEKEGVEVTDDQLLESINKLKELSKKNRGRNNTS